MNLRVTAIETESLGVKSFELRALDGSDLPPHRAGAHIRVTIPGLDGPDPTRAYSLVSDAADRSRYEIAVLRVPEGQGGSATLHDSVAVGDILEVSPPRNEFALEPEARHSVLLAAGIGITPILAFTRELSRQQASFAVHYVARSAERMPYRDTIEALAGPQAEFYLSRSQLDLRRVLASPADGTHVYACGPHVFLEAARLAATEAGFPPARIHFESFGYRRQPSDRAFTVDLRLSGITLRVEPGRSLLETIEAAGVWVPSDCRRGECGTCVTTIAEGEAVHRDLCLSAEQRETALCTCVSWATGDHLALEL